MPEDHCISIYTVFLFCSKTLSMKHSRKKMACILIHWADSVLHLMYKTSRFEAYFVCVCVCVCVYSQLSSDESIAGDIIVTAFQHHQVLIAAGACSV